jgi:phage baseplate assembly protein W
MATNTVFFSDLPLNFIANPITLDIPILKNENAIKRALLNLIKTPVGTRPFRPDYGTRIYNYLFENADPSTEVEINEELAREIQKYEPRVTLISIESDVVDRVGISLKIAYYAQNSPVPQTLETVISRTR